MDSHLLKIVKLFGLIIYWEMRKHFRFIKFQDVYLSLWKKVLANKNKYNKIILVELILIRNLQSIKKIMYSLIRK